MSEQEYIEDKEKIEQRAIQWFGRKKEEVKIISSTRKKCSYDNNILSADTNYIIEVKVRQNYSSEAIWAMNGPILEYTKLKRILEENVDFSILYFNFFKDCLQIFKLKKDLNAYTWTNKQLQKTDYNKTKINKKLTYLTKDDLIETFYYGKQNQISE